MRLLVPGGIEGDVEKRERVGDEEKKKEEVEDVGDEWFVSEAELFV